MTFSTAQFVFDSKLRQSNKNLLDSLKARIINKMFDTYKKQNPIIEYYIGKFKMQLPFSHQLPFIIRLFPHYSTNLARIAKQVKNKYPDMKLIDIGANIGDTVALLRTETMFPILCIEGDEYFFSILQNNATQFSNLYLTKNYVGESSQVVNAVSVELGGTAHLNQTDLINGNAVQLKKLSTILADYQAFSEAKMLKIDTDGFDNKVLRGSLDFLEAVQPIVFFEYDPFFLSQQHEDGIPIFSKLAAIGYKKMLVYENNGDFLLTADLADKRLLEDIDHFYTGRAGQRYCDVCVFHADDDDLLNWIRETELRFFQQIRS